MIRKLLCVLTAVLVFSTTAFAYHFEASTMATGLKGVSVEDWPVADIKIANYGVYVNGEAVPTKEPLLIMSNRTFIHYKDFADIFGGYVDWDGDAEVGRITTDKGYIEFFDNSNKLVVGGNDIILLDNDNPGLCNFLYEGNLYLPLRVACEALDFEVLWEQQAVKVKGDITYKWADAE